MGAGVEQAADATVTDATVPDATVPDATVTDATVPRSGPSRPSRGATRVAALAAGALLVAGAGGVAWFAVGPGSGPKAGPPPQLLDETASSGLAFTYDGPFVYAVGGGVAVLDCDGDGRPDLYLAGGAKAANLFHDDSPVGGALRFTWLPSPITDLVDVNGAYPIDVDGDGITDLVVLRNSGNLVLRGLGGCRFVDQTAAWGLQSGSNRTEGFSATWEPGASWPTVAFANYLNLADDDPATRCVPSWLVRPSASGSGFGAPVSLSPGFCALSVLFSDWDGSGRRDLRVSNDDAYYDPYKGSEQLWRIEPGQPPRLYTAADGWQVVHVEGMGIGSFDLTGDGLPEIYLTSQGANRLQTLAGSPSRPEYRDIGLDHGTNAAHPFTGPNTNLPSTAWHPEFADVNDDGFMDLFVTKGNVTDTPDYAQQDPSNLLLGQPDGVFVEAADKAGIVDFDRGRGAALVDFNLDGRLDLVESFYGAPVKVWRNAGPVGGGNLTANWLQLRLRQPGPNVDAIGAVVEVSFWGRTIRREVNIGGGHGGGQLGWIHVGLGAADRAEVTVRWPDGTSSAPATLGAGTFTILDRAAGPQPWLPPSS